MQLAQMESTDITAAVHQDFTGHSVKRLKACLVHQVCRDVYRILMTCSESASFLLQSEVSWRWAWPFNILESFRLDINYRFWAKWYSSCILHSHMFQRLFFFGWSQFFYWISYTPLFAHCVETRVHGDHLCRAFRWKPKIIYADVRIFIGKMSWYLLVDCLKSSPLRY